MTLKNLTIKWVLVRYRMLEDVFRIMESVVCSQGPIK